MNMIFIFQRITNQANAPIHHVARCHDIGSCFGLRERLLDQDVTGFVIHDVA